MLVEVEAQLQKWNETYFDVPTKIFKRRTLEDEATDCIITPGKTSIIFFLLMWRAFTINDCNKCFAFL